MHIDRISALEDQLLCAFLVNLARRPMIQRLKGTHPYMATVYITQFGYFKV